MRALEAISDYQPNDDGSFGFRLARHLKGKGFQDSEIGELFGVRAGVQTLSAAQYMWVRALHRGKYSTPEQRAAFERDLMKEVSTIGTHGADKDGGRALRRQYELYMRENLKKLFGWTPAKSSNVPFRKQAMPASRKNALLGSLEKLERNAQAEKDKLIDPPF